jgi:NADH-quinone oxidoreductase subunit L
MLMSLSVVGVLLTIGFAWFLFRNYRERESKGLLRFFEHKWYVDELYDRLIVKPIFYLGRLLKEWVEPRFIDALVNGVGKTVQLAGRQIRFLQSGQIGSYVLLMVLAMVTVLLVQFFIRK